jgi:hypothetical protein
MSMGLMSDHPNEFCCKDKMLQGWYTKHGIKGVLVLLYRPGATLC